MAEKQFEMSKTAQYLAKVNVTTSLKAMHSTGYDGLDIAVGAIEALREFVLDCAGGGEQFDDAIYPLAEILRAPDASVNLKDLR